MIAITSAWLARLRSNRYVYSIVMLVSGTGLGHLLTFLSLPILTRHFSPNDFEVLGVFVAIVALLSSAACCRFEIAIPLPKRDKNALTLFLLSLICTTIISLLSLILILIFESKILEASSVPVFILYLVPIGVFCAATFNALQFWATREKAFDLVAKTRVSQAVAGNGTQLLAAFLSIPSGLVFGQLLNYVSGIFSTSKYLLTHHGQVLKTIKKKHLYFIARRYRQYPQLSTFEVLANNGGIQLPIVLIAYFVVGPEAGYLFLALKILQVPMALIGGSIAQVFYAEVAKASKDQVAMITEKNLLSLLKLGVGPLIFIGCTAEVFSGYIFGDGWRRTGEIMMILTPWFALQFLASPISMIMHVNNAQKQMLCLTLFGFAIRIGSLIFAYFVFSDHYTEFLGLACAVFYLICLITFSYKSNVSYYRLLGQAAIPIGIVFLWAILAVAVRGVFL